MTVTSDGFFLGRAPGDVGFNHFDIGQTGNDVLYLSEKINDLGIECSHFADGAGLAFEAFEKGLLKPEQIGGMRLEWGDAKVTERLLEMCARREGWLGNLHVEIARLLKGVTHSFRNFF